MVPAIDEEDHEKRRDIRAAHRQEDVAKELHGARPVDTRRLGQFIGDGEKELAKEKSRRGRRDKRKDQTLITVEHAKARDHLIGRHDANLDREHQGEEDQPEEHIPPRKAEIDDGKGRGERNDDFAHGNSYRHDQRIAQHGQHRHVHAREKCCGVILDQLVTGPERHRRAHDFRLRHGRGDESQPDRKENHEHARDHAHMREPETRTAPLHHACDLARHQ